MHTHIHTNTQFGKMNLDRELEGAEDATAFDRAFNYSVRSSISYAPNFRCYFYVELFVRQRGGVLFAHRHITLSRSSPTSPELSGCCVANGGSMTIELRR